MAQTSITVPISRLYDGLHSGGNYKDYYRNLQQSSILMNKSSDVHTDEINAYVSIPDLKATLGRHLLYRFAATIRLAAPLPATGLAQPVITRLEKELPSLNPGSQYILAPADNIKPTHDWDYIFSTRPIPEPGSDFVLDNYGSASDQNISYFTYLVLKYKAFRMRSFASNIRIYSTLENGGTPTITIYYDSTEVATRSISSVSGITSGYWNPRKAHTVEWALAVDANNAYYCLDTDILPAHETMYWRESGAANWTSISIPDGASSCSVPANTFPVGKTIEWYVSVTDQDNITSNSSVFTVTTDDDTSTATPVSPVNSVEIGNKPITFTWTVSNPSGEEPSRVIVEWATAADAEEWTELLDVNEAVYNYTAAANTFPGGNVYWKVTSYNADDEEGPTSDVVSFACVAPPSPPTNVTANSAPFTTVSWQAAVQTAYEITVDGKVVEKKFGTGVYSYQLTEPLPDGPHSIGVRVQGGYGYWSTVTTTTTVTENEGEGTISADGAFGTDALLSWVCSSEEENIVFRIYRDGDLIARTENNSFLDRFVLGQHSYEILAELSGGNYIRSAAVSGIMKSCVAQIAAAAGGSWLELKLSENSNRVESFEWNRNLTLRHYAGSAYPVAEFSPYEDRKATYDCAFTTVEAARAFEQLQGQIVILKSRGGEVMIGPLTPISKVTVDFYITYQFTVQQIHWEDFIDDTGS